MNVSLTPELERFVTARVKSGMYSSSSEVIRAALRLLQPLEADQAARLEALRRDVGVGLAQADRGEVVNGELAFQQLRQGLVVKRAAKASAKPRPRRQKRAAR